MNIHNTYHTRSVRFIEIHRHIDWKIKLYGISTAAEFVSNQNIVAAKAEISKWLDRSVIHNFENYKVATLIIHEAREGCFAIINWWVDENMLQHFVYFRKSSTATFTLFSDSGVITCVWEMAVLWHERNAWVKHILMKNENPDLNAYLNDALNTNI